MFSHTPHRKYLQINTKLQTLLIALTAATSDQATVTSHKDTCCHLLSRLPASTLLVYSLVLTPQQEWAMPRCSVQSPLIASHFTPRNFPAAPLPHGDTTYLYALMAYCFPTSPTLLWILQPPCSSDMPGRAPAAPLQLLFPFPGMFSPPQIPAGSLMFT